MKKTMVLAILVGAMCALVLSCASSGGGSGGGEAGEVFEGTWKWYETTTTKTDGDLSTCTIVEAQEVINGETVTTYTITGEVIGGGNSYNGEGEWRAAPDAETKEKLKTAKAISFWMIADGSTYRAKIPISTVTDYAYHMRSIKTEEGVPTEYTLQFRSFTQPSWGTTVRFNQNLIDELVFTTISGSDGGIGPYSVKMWGLKLIM